MMYLNFAGLLILFGTLWALWLRFEDELLMSKSFLRKRYAVSDIRYKLLVFRAALYSCFTAALSLVGSFGIGRVVGVFVLVAVFGEYFRSWALRILDGMPITAETGEWYLWLPFECPGWVLRFGWPVRACQIDNRKSLKR